MLVRDGAHRARGLHAAPQPQLRLRRRRVRVPGRRRRPRRQRPGGRSHLRRAHRRRRVGQLGIERGGLAFWVAAVRECFEEAGVLLAVDETGARRVAGRRGDRRRVSPSGVTRSTTARPASSRSARPKACASWRATSTTSPTGSRRSARPAVTTRASSSPPRRPTSGRCTTTARRSPRSGSTRPRRCESTSAHEMELIFPTIRNLEAISRFDTAARVARRGRGDRRSRHRSCPRVVQRRRPACASCCPGDPGYDDVIDGKLPVATAARSSTTARSRIETAHRRPTRRWSPARSSNSRRWCAASRARTPGVFTGPGTNTYLIGDPTSRPRRRARPGPRRREAHRGASRVPVRRARSRRSSSPTPTPTTRRASRRSRRCTGATVIGFDSPRRVRRPTSTRATATSCAPTTSRCAPSTRRATPATTCAGTSRTRDLLFSGDHVMAGINRGDLAARRRHAAVPRLARARARHARRRRSRRLTARCCTTPDAILGWYIDHRLEREQMVRRRARPARQRRPSTQLVEDVYTDVRSRPVSDRRVLAVGPPAQDARRGPGHDTQRPTTSRRRGP